MPKVYRKPIVSTSQGTCYAGIFIIIFLRWCFYLHYDEHVPLCNILGLVCHGFLGFKLGVESEALEVFPLSSDPSANGGDRNSAHAD